MTTMNEISIAEALRKIDSGESILGCQINFDHLKVEALDVMKLAKHGIKVPDAAIYYDDEDIIVDDEDFDGDWERIDFDPTTSTNVPTELQINLSTDVKKWIESQNIPLSKLLEGLLEGFYRSQQLIAKGK